jgi:hypothetical protein
MRLLHYPGIPIEERDEMVPGIGAHTGETGLSFTPTVFPDPVTSSRLLFHPARPSWRSAPGVLA